ncbi:MAG: hypothetical protein IT293_01120 [Deltaproteobacteria bacterium]|nr:hypothetical protein [Deltaproteobacteria bacterium]
MTKTLVNWTGTGFAAARIPLSPVIRQRAVRLRTYLRVEGLVLAPLLFGHLIECEGELCAGLHQPLLRLVRLPLHREELQGFLAGDAVRPELFGALVAVRPDHLALVHFLGAA